MMSLLRNLLITVAVVLCIPAALWLAVAIHTMFYDSLGDYHSPTLAHVGNNLFLGMAPFVVPVILLVLARSQRRSTRSM